MNLRSTQLTMKPAIITPIMRRMLKKTSAKLSHRSRAISRKKAFMENIL